MSENEKIYTEFESFMVNDHHFEDQKLAEKEFNESIWRIKQHSTLAMAAKEPKHASCDVCPLKKKKAVNGQIIDACLPVGKALGYGRCGAFPMEIMEEIEKEECN
jgi:hypothetical protein